MITLLLSCVVADDVESSESTISSALLMETTATEGYANVLDFGATQTEDDSPSFHAAIEALRNASGERVLYIPDGVYHLVNVGNRNHSLKVDLSDLRIQCESQGRRTVEECDDLTPCSDGVCDLGVCVTGTMLQGDLDVVAWRGSDWPSKDMIAMLPPAQDVLHDVVMDSCGLEYQRPHFMNEQAHAITMSSMMHGDWVRDVWIRNTTIGPVGSGDGTYCGSGCEGLRVDNVEVFDAARAGVVVAGHAQDVNVRTGFRISNLDVYATGFNPEQEGGPSIDFEVSRPEIRLSGVVIDKVRAPNSSMHLTHIDDGHLESITASRLVLSKVDRMSISEPNLTCLPGNGGDGAGYCVSSFLPPADFKILQGVYNVHPDGAGLLYVRDYRGSSKVEPFDQHYRVEVLGGRVRLNGGHLIRPDILADPLYVHVSLNEIP